MRLLEEFHYYCILVIALSGETCQLTYHDENAYGPSVFDFSYDRSLIRVRSLMDSLIVSCYHSSSQGPTSMY